MQKLLNNYINLTPDEGVRHRNKSEYNETNTYYRSAASFHQLHVAKERAHLSLARESTWRAEKKEGALQDAQRALRVVRQKAPKWNIDPEKVGIMGFSAGGSLSASTSTLFSKRTYVPMDAADSLSCHPADTDMV